MYSIHNYVIIKLQSNKRGDKNECNNRWNEIPSKH